MEPCRLHWPAVETALSLPTHEKEKPDAPMSKVVNRGQERRSWRLLDALLCFRVFEPIRYREFRLMWFEQVFTTMATWMDQVARGLLSVHSRCNPATRSRLRRSGTSLNTLRVTVWIATAIHLDTHNRILDYFYLPYQNLKPPPCVTRCCSFPSISAMSCSRR